jgi:hypothetical protein
LALGFLATKERPDVLTLTVPAELAAALADALEQLRSVSSASARLQLDTARGSLSGPPDQLAELLAVAIDEAGEQLGQRCSGLLRGTAAAPEVREDLTVLGGLLDLLERVASEAQPI